MEDNKEDQKVGSKAGEEITQLISLVPKHLRRFIKQGIFFIPSAAIIEDYPSKKAGFLQAIRNSQ